MTNILNS